MDSIPSPSPSPLNKLDNNQIILLHIIERVEPEQVQVQDQLHGQLEEKCSVLNICIIFTLIITITGLCLCLASIVINKR